MTVHFVDEDDDTPIVRTTYVPRDEQVIARPTQARSSLRWEFLGAALVMGPILVIWVASQLGLM